VALSTVQPRTFLQLVQDLWREVGAAGIAPTTTVSQSGELLRLVNYVHDAELEIQNLWSDWKFLRKTLSFYTYTNNQTGIFTDNTGSTSAFPADLAEWDYKTWFLIPPGQTLLQPIQCYEWFEVRDQVFDTVSRAQPWRAIVMPDNTIRWDLIPDQPYQGQVEYRSVPYDLKADADVSNIPARFANRIIVEWARMKYGLFENAAEQYNNGKTAVYGVVSDDGIVKMPGLLAQLENDQLPNKKNARLSQGAEIVVGGASGSDGSYDYYGGAY